MSAARAAQLQRARAAAASRTINMLTEGELDYAMRLDKRAPLPLRQRVRRSLEVRLHSRAHTRALVPRGEFG